MNRLLRRSALLCAFSVFPSLAQLTYPGCRDLRPEDFKFTEVFNRHGNNGATAGDPSLAEPVQFDLRAVRQGDSLKHVDIYFVERLGKVKHYDGVTRKVSLVGTIPVLGLSDNGLMGLALHPDFESNRWIFFWYSPKELLGQNRQLRLSRFTLTADNKLDMASEKRLIEIKASRADKYHSGGPMTFDSHGDLWVTVGNNGPNLDPDACSAGGNVMSPTDSTESGEWGSSNTANLRGSIFRIHPDNSSRGYVIPPGNFADHWAAKFESSGKAALAAEYRNPAKVLPEIYVKGNRSNYSIAVHPTKRWLAWGEVNYGSTFDEFNLVTGPVFAGYPYFHAGNKPTCAHGKDPLAPRNTSPLNTGVENLPPAVPGTFNDLHKVAISGPIHVYRRDLASPIQFPPHFDHTWLTFSFGTGQMSVHSLDPADGKVLKTLRLDNGLFQGLKLRSPLQAKYGPDGALYILNYDGFYTTINPGITRVDNLLSCSPGPISIAAARAGGAWATLEFNSLRIRDPGIHEVKLYDRSGRLVLKRQGTGKAEYDLSDLARKRGLGRGAFLLKARTGSGELKARISLL